VEVGAGTVDILLFRDEGWNGGCGHCAFLSVGRFGLSLRKLIDVEWKKGDGIGVRSCPITCKIAQKQV
jgi:hypothetical protein